MCLSNRRGHVHSEKLSTIFFHDTLTYPPQTDLSVFQTKKKPTSTTTPRKTPKHLQGKNTTRAAQRWFSSSDLSHDDRRKDMCEGTFPASDEATFQNEAAVVHVHLVHPAAPAPEKNNCVDTCILTSALHAYTTDRNHRQPDPNRRHTETPNRCRIHITTRPTSIMAYQQHDRAPSRFHPSRHNKSRLFTRKNVWQMPQSTTNGLGTVCATSLRKGLPELEAQLRGLAPSRNCHDAADRVKAAGDGYRDTRQQISVSQDPMLDCG